MNALLLIFSLLIQLNRVDILLPMTGPLSPIGKDMFDGIKMGVGRTKVELHLWDTKGNPGKVYEEAVKITGKEPSLIVGPLTSLNVASLLRVVEDYDIPVVSPLARDLSLIDEYDFYYPFAGKYYYELKEEMRFVVNILGYYNFAFIMPSTSSGYSLMEQARKFSLMYGVRIVFQDFYDPEGTDFSELVDRLNSVDVEAIFIPYCDEGSYILAGQIRASENFTPIFGLESWSKRAINRGLGTIDRVLIASLPIDYRVEIQRETSLKRFEEAFNDIFGRPPSRYNIIGYDIGRLIRTLSKQDGLATSEAAVRVLNSMGIFHGLYEDILLSRDERFITFYLVKTGKLQKLREEDYGYLKVAQKTP